MKRIHRTNTWPKSHLWDTKNEFSVLWRASSYWSGPWRICAWSGCWGRNYAQSIAWHYYTWKEFTELTYPANLSCGHTIGPVLGTARVHQQTLGAGFGKNPGLILGWFFWISLWNEHTELVTQAANIIYGLCIGPILGMINQIIYVWGDGAVFGWVLGRIRGYLI